MGKPKGMTIADHKREYGTEFKGVNPQMRLATWAERNGFPSLGKVMRKVEAKLYKKTPS